MGSIAALMSRFIFELVIVLLPILLLAVIVGLIIAVLQTVTSIQEQTLSFVPKLIVIFLALWFLGSWMMSRLIAFTVYIIQQLEVI